MSLLSLPLEIIEQICLFISKRYLRARTKILRVLALTCRTFYTAVIPYLYRHICSEQRSLYLLARTIIERPGLASHIKWLNIRLLRGKFDPKEAYDFLKRPGVLSEICGQYLKSNKPTVNLVLAESLLIHLNNLDTLFINFAAFPKNATFLDQQRWKLGRKPLVPNLDCLRIYSHTPSFKKRRFDILSQSQVLLQYTKAPHLSIDIEFVLRYYNVRINLHAVRRLDIRASDVDRAGLKRLLAACPNLDTFQYCSMYGRLADDDYDTLKGDTPIDDNDEFFEAVPVQHILSDLNPLRRHLTRLELLFSPIEPELSPATTLSSLRQFSQLKYLHVSSETLNGVGLNTSLFLGKLPKCLETLRVSNPHADHLDIFKALPAGKSRDCPNLKRLVLYECTNGSEQLFREMHADLEDAGIELRVLSRSDPEKDVLYSEEDPAFNAFWNDCGEQSDKDEADK